MIRQSVKLPQMSNKPIELDLPERLFLIGKGSLKAGSQTAVKIEVWSYMDRSVIPKEVRLALLALCCPRALNMPVQSYGVRCGSEVAGAV